MARKKKIASLTRRLHRSFGAFAALFVLFMVISGLVINHAPTLGLEKKHVAHAFVLDWYGIKEPGNLRGFNAGAHWLIFADSGLYLDGNYLTTLSNGVGAVFKTDMLIAAGDEELLLLTAEGDLIERMPWSEQETGKITSIGMRRDGAVAVKSQNTTWLADDQFLQWQRVSEEDADFVWSRPTPLPENIHTAVSRHFRGDGLTMERLLLDLHSGRFFGPAGVLVYDLFAATIGFLAISGLVLWMRGRRNGKKASSK